MGKSHPLCLKSRGWPPFFISTAVRPALTSPRLPAVNCRPSILRHRQANQIRTGLLSKIITACEKAGVQLILLKGAALFHLVYPEPGLRPMRDLDLLIHPSQAPVMETLLGDLGFTVLRPN